MFNGYVAGLCEDVNITKIFDICPKVKCNTIE